MKGARPNRGPLRPPPGVILLLATLVALLVAFQAVTLDKIAILPPGLRFDSPSHFFDNLHNWVDFDLADGLLAGGILLVVIALLAVEFRRRDLSLFLRWGLASRRRSLALLSASLLVLLRFYFARGEISWAGDASQHILYTHLASLSFGQGEWPLWTNSLGAGSPYLLFYGFLFFYLSGAAAALLGDLFFALKLVMALSHLLSGVGMYLLAAQVTGSRRAGAVAGLGFALCFWHTQHVLVMGRLPLSLFYGLLPWPFYAFERLLRTPHPAAAAGAGALVLALLAFTHPGYAFWATALFALYGLARLGCLRHKAFARTRLPYALALFAGGLVVGAQLTLPMWLERQYTGLSSGYELGGIAAPTLHHLLVWSNYRFWVWPLPEDAQHWYGGYLGLSLTLLGLAGALLPLCRPLRRWLAAALPPALGLLACLLLVFAHDLPPLRSLALVQALPASRYLLFLCFFLSLSAGVGAALLLRPGRKPFLLPLLVLLFDLGLTTFLHPYPSPHSDPQGFDDQLYGPFRAQAQPYLDRGELPPDRFLWITGPLHPYLANSQMVLRSGMPTPFGPHPGDLLAASAYTDPLIRLLGLMLQNAADPDALEEHPHFPLVSASLQLLNVRHLLIALPDRSISVIIWSSHAPVLVSPRVSAFPTAELETHLEREEIRDFLRRTFPGRPVAESFRHFYPLLWLIDTSGIQPVRRRCEHLFLLDYEGAEDLGTDPRVEVLEHRVWPQRAELAVRLSEPAFARLAYSYYPYLEVYVDGQRVQPLRTAEHFIALRLDAGEHRIVLRPHLSPLRRGLLWLNGALVLVGLFLCWRERRSR